MGEKINFPKNYEAFFKKGIIQFQNGNLEEACRYFEAAYAIKQEPIVNTMYVSALLQLGDYQLAKEIADEKKEVYKKDDKLYGLYTTILIKNHLFVEAERIIQKNLLRQDQQNANPIWETAQLELEKERIQQKREKEKSNQELVKNILAMGSKSFEYQSTLVKQMGELDSDMYIFSSKNLLSNPFVNEIVKTTVFEGLIKQKSDVEFELYWFQERRLITPSKATSLEENETVKEMLSLLSDKFEDSNPTLHEMLQQEINLHFLLLHPFIDEVITDVHLWLALCFKRYDINVAVSNDEEAVVEKLSQWMERLNKEIENMVQ